MSSAIHTDITIGGAHRAVTAPRELLETFRLIVEQLQIHKSIHSLLPDTESSDGLHLSLSRPLQLWTSQRSDFRAAVQEIVESRTR